MRMHIQIYPYQCMCFIYTYMYLYIYGGVCVGLLSNSTKTYITIAPTLRSIVLSNHYAFAEE